MNNNELTAAIVRSIAAMTLLEKIDHLKALAEAEQRGEKIQSRPDAEPPVWSDVRPYLTVKDLAEYILGEYPHRYRIAPKPKVRAWRLDEVPVGAVIKYKKGSGYAGTWLIGGVNESRVHLSLGGQSYNTEHFLEKATMLDGSPCGVTEDSK